MQKWLVVILSIFSICIWLAVIWVVLGKEEISTASNHTISKSEVTLKTYSGSLFVGNLSSQIQQEEPKEKQNEENINRSAALSNYGVSRPISIDTILSDLGIAN